MKCQTISNPKLPKKHDTVNHFGPFQMVLELINIRQSFPNNLIFSQLYKKLSVLYSYQPPIFVLKQYTKVPFRRVYGIIKCFIFRKFDGTSICDDVRFSISRIRSLITRLKELPQFYKVYKKSSCLTLKLTNREISVEVVCSRTINKITGFVRKIIFKRTQSILTRGYEGNTLI